MATLVTAPGCRSWWQNIKFQPQPAGLPVTSGDGWLGIYRGLWHQASPFPLEALAEFAGIPLLSEISVCLGS